MHSTILWSMSEYPMRWASLEVAFDGFRLFIVPSSACESRRFSMHGGIAVLAAGRKLLLGCLAGPKSLRVIEGESRGCRQLHGCD